MLIAKPPWKILVIPWVLLLYYVIWYERWKCNFPAFKETMADRVQRGWGHSSGLNCLTLAGRQGWFRGGSGDRVQAGRSNQPVLNRNRWDKCSENLRALSDTARKNGHGWSVDIRTNSYGKYISINRQTWTHTNTPHKSASTYTQTQTQDYLNVLRNRPCERMLA